MLLPLALGLVELLVSDPVLGEPVLSELLPPLLEEHPTAIRPARAVIAINFFIMSPFS